MSPIESITTAISQVTNIAKPVVQTSCDFAKALLGEPLRVAGLALADHVYAWQTRNRIRILDKTRTLVQKKQIDPQYVATGFLIHALEAIGNVEDDGLQELWARLLAGAIDNDSIQVTLHIETLRRLSPDDAVVLNAMANAVNHAWKSKAVESRHDDSLESMWLTWRWGSNLPPHDNIADVWIMVLSRLEAVNVIERDSVRATQEIANSLSKYYDRSRMHSMFTHDGEEKQDPFKSMQLHRLSSDLKQSVQRAETWLITSYGLELLKALDLLDSSYMQTEGTHNT